MHPLQAQIEETLEAFGGFYTFDDIVQCVKDGKMQGFVQGDSWAVTQVCEFPQKKALDIVFAVGRFEELEIIEADITGFAREHDIDIIFSNGRLGFDGKKLPGWKKVSAIYVKDLRHGS